MNTAILVTKKNADDMIETAKLLAASQSSPVNGALVIIHTSTAQHAVQPIADALGTKFPAVHSIKSVTSERSEAIAQGVLMARFMIGCYARFPGPWLIFDSWAKPLIDDVLNFSLRQHRAIGAPVSGRADIQVGKTIPVGPVVIGAVAKTIKFLRFASAESWRERLGVMLSRGGFGLVPAEEWPFTLSRSTGHERVVVVADPPEAFNPETATEDELRAELFKITGRRPHHFTGREKLLDMFHSATA